MTASMGTKAHVTSLDWGTAPRQKVSPGYVPRGGWTQPRAIAPGNRMASAVLAPRPTCPHLPAHLAHAAEKQPKNTIPALGRAWEVNKGKFGHTL